MEEEIKYYSPIIKDTKESHFDGGKSQMDRYEEQLKIDAQKAKERKERYNKFLLKKLEEAPVISVVSDSAIKKIEEGRFSHFSDFAKAVARITQKENPLKENYIKEDVEKIITTFSKIITSLCEIGELNLTHYTWVTVDILYDTWIYGEVVRRWWNKQYLSGEELDSFVGVYDYRYKNRNIPYRIALKPKFPGL